MKLAIYQDDAGKEYTEYLHDEEQADKYRNLKLLNEVPL